MTRVRSPALLRSNTRGRIFGALCAALVAMLSSVGHADEAAENIAAARTLGIQGVQLADAGKCPEAIEKLTRAEALHHAPTILSRLGECQVNVGEVVNGTENLNMVVREELPASAPKVFREAQKRAKKVLNAAMPKIAYLTIRVTPSEVKANVSVAGKAVPAALLGAERPTDPGTHQVSAAAEGYKPASATITLGEGAHQELSLLLEKDSSAVSALPASTSGALVTTHAIQDEAVAPTDKQSKAPALLAFGVGGAGLIVGGITGALALRKASDCPNKVCESQSDLDSAKTMATISTIGFSVGVAGVAVGTILWLTGSSSDRPAQAKGLAPQFAMQPFLSANSVGVTGSFQ